MSDLIRKTKDSAHSLVLLLIQDKRGGEIWTEEIRLKKKKACRCDSNQTAVCSQLCTVTDVCGLTRAGRRVSQWHWFGASGSLYSVSENRSMIVLPVLRCHWQDSFDSESVQMQLSTEACPWLVSEPLTLQGPPSQCGLKVWRVGKALQV